MSKNKYTIITIVILSCFMMIGILGCSLYILCFKKYKDNDFIRNSIKLMYNFIFIILMIYGIFIMILFAMSIID